MSESLTPTLELSGISKSFGSVTAVDGIDLVIMPHEVVGLIGENGAGKSSLLKIMTGNYQPDGGSMSVNGRQVRFRTPKEATHAGIGVVHQEQSLLTNLSVAENIEMNSASAKGGATRFGLYRWGLMNRRAAECLAKVGADIDPRARVADLPFVDRQMVEIARAMNLSVATGSPLLILDEPTSVLEKDEIVILEREINVVREFGSVVFVSHRLDEILRVCTRVVVMRAGRIVADLPVEDADHDELFRLMIGRESRAEAERPADASVADPVVTIEALSRRGEYENVSLSLVPGRITAIVGANGSGRESVARAVFGAERSDAGRVAFQGDDVTNWSITRAVSSGVAYVPSERKTEGIVGGMTAEENLTLARGGASRRGPFIDRRSRRRIAEGWFDRLDVRPGVVSLPLEQFSGGNQQKVVMAKWLNDPGLRVLLLDHPLRGLDPGAAETVNAQIVAACSAGVAVLLLPDTLEEALTMADEIIVMRDGVVTATFESAVEKPTSLELMENLV